MYLYFYKTFFYNFLSLKFYLLNYLHFFRNFQLVELIILLLVLLFDSLIIDDEPLWEPVEWSMVQFWILIIFTFSWIFENLITSRYGSYVGKDKRVWLGWFKTYWLVDLFYALNFGAAALFVITPYYYETKYLLPFVYSWWDVFNRLFMFKFIFLLTFILEVGYFIQIISRWVNWKSVLFLVSINLFIIVYILFTQYIILIFNFFTDTMWHINSKFIDYIQLSHGPSRWGWGGSDRDHFYQHMSRTVFWFKNDGPLAASFLIFNFFFTLSLFFLFFYWITLFRRLYSTKEVPVTFLTYCSSSIRHFLNGFLFFYIMITLSYIFNYTRLPYEYAFTQSSKPWVINFYSIIIEYPNFLILLIFS